MLRIILALILSLILISCGDGLSGNKYSDKLGLMTMEFKDGKVTIGSMGAGIEMRYKVEDSKLKVSAMGVTQVYEMKDGIIITPLGPLTKVEKIKKGSTEKTISEVKPKTDDRKAVSSSSILNKNIKCIDVVHGNENYQSNMERLAKLAKLHNGYFNRYHEDVVSCLCKGTIDEINELIDYGYLEKSEVLAIKDVLEIKEVHGLLEKRSELGKRYGDFRKKLLDMGLCSACQDNVAQYLIKQPDSTCGKLAKKALAGDSGAIDELVSGPAYCVWTY
jgi:hypothetical protein